MMESSILKPLPLLSCVSVVSPVEVMRTLKDEIEVSADNLASKLKN
jgi:hypothetical protein